MNLAELPDPTERELEILKILWERGQASVREVYEVLRERRPVAQNTVQAFLRTMEEKGLVRHHLEGRSFIYQAVPQREKTNRRLLRGLLERVFDGSMEQLVESAIAVRKPTAEELARLREMLDATHPGDRHSPQAHSRPQEDLV